MVNEFGLIRRNKITKKLHELFNLPESTVKDSDSPMDDKVEEVQVSESALSNLEKIEAALPKIKDIETSDKELDDLAELAVNGFKDLQDLGFNVEARFASDIFSSAAAMLGHAITAKTAKINKKLKQVDLMLKKAQLDSKIEKNKTNEHEPEATEGSARILDRNELLKILSESPDNIQLKNIKK